ncbi:DUF2332 domain-containing protein [Micromonospora sp. NBC_01655]|uniref:DUF2332 domain-containing protein n=1 Tax=Micromonospora sp. NBC_01655 TaxID=2975983 RepID=UPI00225B227D|nr:DUF2332 domain-containing protein [Micromonospora sp. NBC_01655]MCX4469352.1 DUF2332 domain-containing protein [Micromonospora sp. NBC_01655]
MDTARWYRAFGEREARGETPTYERLALAVAGDPGLLALLDGLPEPKRQPNLIFGAVRHLGGPVDDPAAFRRWTADHWAEVAATVRARRTQTNEAARCAVLLPLLARLPQPLALLEVGASAGLCLYPDAYRYRYVRPGADDHLVGPAGSAVRLTCAVAGDVRLPGRVPEVVWRAGLDLNPLDVTDPDDLGWLTALVWPEQHGRRDRLTAAARVARADPPLLRRGDLLTDLPALAAAAPPEATLVVFHSAVLAYVPPVARTGFARTVAGLPGHWIANEAAGVLPAPADSPAPPPGEATRFLLSLDGRPVAWAGPHGQSLHGLTG